LIGRVVVNRERLVDLLDEAVLMSAIRVPMVIAST
jgi:hypothetical protein